MVIGGRETVRTSDQRARARGLRRGHGHGNQGGPRTRTQTIRNSPRLTREMSFGGQMKCSAGKRKYAWLVQELTKLPEDRTDGFAGQRGNTVVCKTQEYFSIAWLGL